jgi:hypothetical protein
MVGVTPRTGGGRECPAGTCPTKVPTYSSLWVVVTAPWPVELYKIPKPSTRALGARQQRPAAGTLALGHETTPIGRFIPLNPPDGAELTSPDGFHLT